MVTDLVAVTVTVMVAAVVVAGATFKGVEVMESVEFCGMACHKVMEPEHTAFQRSAHSRLACANCHIGPGADWFVKSKISGSWQLIAVAFNLYPTPIPQPDGARPAVASARASAASVLRFGRGEDGWTSEGRSLVMPH